MKLRLSHKNPEIKQLYEEFYGEPLSGLAEEIFHTKHQDRSGDINQEMKKEKSEKWQNGSVLFAATFMRAK